MWFKSNVSLFFTGLETGFPRSGSQNGEALMKILLKDGFLRATTASSSLYPRVVEGERAP